MIEWEFYFCA